MKTNGKPLYLSIKNRLAVFVGIICFAVIVLTFMIFQMLLDPIYYKTIDTRLKSTIAETSRILQQDEFSNSGIQELIELAKGGICIEISDRATLKPLLVAEGIGAACLLHPNDENGNFLGDVTTEAFLVSLRIRAIDENFEYIYTSRSNRSQRIFARSIDDRYVVLLCASLAQIDISKAVINRLLWIAVIFILPLCSLVAYFFSKYFTAPLSMLREATRRVAAGNYNYETVLNSNDEFGELENDLVAMVGELKRTSGLKDELIANISHDVRTPLTLIKGYAETIRDITGEDMQKREQQLDIIIEETDRLAYFVADVMELSKQSSGNVPLLKSNFDICGLMREVCERENRLAELLGCKITLLLPQEEYLVNADPGQLTVLLHNLIDNAIKHVGDDKTVTVSANADDNALRITVEDHGKGISKEDINFIFDRYYRARQDRGEKGNGLGLAISKAVLLQHGYNFGVDSIPGKGSRFWFSMG